MIIYYSFLNLFDQIVYKHIIRWLVFQLNLYSLVVTVRTTSVNINTLNAELNPICYLLALLGAHHFLHVSRIRVKQDSRCTYNVTSRRVHATVVAVEKQ